ncbi:uncharacterized protein EDB91DRAFT_1108314 [Suillus paluster]|uniref:uncharacterized protein n=1 Tax=Suillus paluster TaxID=48578 RepID=UPI001B867ED1|nr:uncharacterized protein EDB91DRAFT_1108314 [Suillus paluster]KAG1750591.1 hypothetical protein EDB91DRAFT_1108314 [Suillus paluster]
MMGFPASVVAFMPLCRAPVGNICKTCHWKCYVGELTDQQFVSAVGRRSLVLWHSQKPNTQGTSVNSLIMYLSYLPYVLLRKSQDQLIRITASSPISRTDVLLISIGWYRQQNKRSKSSPIIFVLMNASKIPRIGLRLLI